MNYLGIDWGEKRIGLAFADEIGIAMPLQAAVAASKKERMRHIEDMIAQRRAQELVVGYPLNMDGSVGFKAKEVDVFIEELEKRFRLPIHRVDERLSSHSVEQGLRGQKKKPTRQSGEIDSRAAALILQDFIEERSIRSGL
ncbi:Holliday junction resolvase RuvX [Coraliomargarita sp. SDUM461003]|uniref:Putative pre-16S rRNA nuclease n=1 Tax=Thalassobacterium maritimum TaxID=3041265 RepID=A0ABU1AXD1_9BACT|nr:Holliday junction resolvase RuvX [Coraliomargarita sp. SDUM461003]MDQ8208746.1 Holliday junction resolvase RuvX [Coraliomargarita sp. SDUM461003]